MKGVKHWIRIDPLDTLFFKGSEPMIAGESHEVRSTFPPMPSTLRGALCTAILHQREIKPWDFTGPAGPDPKIRQRYPLLGEPGSLGFDTVGPILQVTREGGEEDWLLPAPANWFADLSRGPETKIAVAQPLPSRFSKLGLCGSVAEPVWVLNPEEPEMKSLAGCWTNLQAWEASRQGAKIVRVDDSLDETISGEAAIFSGKALFAFESRVGIAREILTRRAKRGHLYSATQVRLKAGVFLVIGLVGDLVPDYLDSSGILHLGGEQRIARYEVLAAGPPLSNGKTPWALSLSPFPIKALKDLKWQMLPRVSGPLIRMGGWDMKLRFHKPMEAFLPAGTVIFVGENTSIPSHFVRI